MTDTAVIALILAVVVVYVAVTRFAYVASSHADTEEFSTQTLVLVALLWPFALAWAGCRAVGRALRWCLSDG